MGGSIDAENVQALAASKNLVDIPRRYIRPEIASAVTIDDDVPIIDLGKLLDPRSSADEAAKLKIACEDWGFFQVVNHGVPDEVTRNLKADVEVFFQLPLEEKEASAQLQRNGEGYGQISVSSDDQKLEWSDIYYLQLLPVADRKMGLWSTRPSTFRATLDKYSAELKKIVDCLLRWMAVNLGIHSEILVDMFKDCRQSARMNYYPPCPHADKVLGIAPHSDGVGLTLLLEINGVPGLQIRRNGGWLPIKPQPGAFVVNIGDMIEILSNGKYKSIEHRAVINPEKARLSIAAFHSPKDDALIGPLPELVKEGLAYYRSVTVESYIGMFFTSKVEGKNILDRMKL